MFDTEREQLRKTYQLCRFGFGSYGAALLVASMCAVIDLLCVFRLEQVRWIVSQPWYQWLDTPIVWFRLIGAILLWGRWDQKSWQRRTGLLLALCMADLVLWFVAEGRGAGTARRRCRSRISAVPASPRHELGPDGSALEPGRRLSRAPRHRERAASRTSSRGR